MSNPNNPKFVKMPFEVFEATFNLSRDLKFGNEPNLGDIERVYGWIDDWMARQARHQLYSEELEKRKIQE